MGNSPSIFEKTPQEHAVATARYLEKQREIAIWPPEPVVPPGHARVQFYAYRYKVRDGLRPDMEAILPLEKSGALSLFAVRRLWGLETCSVIDPPALKLGFPADPNWLPANVVKQLIAKHGCIKLIEPYTSYETLMKRQLRHVALAVASVTYSWSILARYGAQKDFTTLHRLATKSYHITKSHTIAIDWAHAVYLAVFLLITFLVFTSTSGILSRLGDFFANTLAASTFLSLGGSAVLAVFFCIAPSLHAQAMGLEDDTKMIKQLSCFPHYGLLKAALDKGFRVIATARKVETLAALESLGAKTLALDVTSTPAALQEFATSAIAIFGQVDYLVNNAGYLQGGAIEEVSPAQAFAQFNTNVFGLVNTTNAFLPHFRARRPLMGMPGVGWYAASKGALDVLSDTWANELAEYGIRSISVQPGAFRTDVFQSSNVRFPETTIDGYQAAHGVVESIPAWKQPGDAAKASRNIITLVTKPGSNLPLRFVIGDEAFPNAEKFYKARLAELEVVRELGTRTSFPA
ncbi:hypothetical protein DFH06DRAFT_1485669 [Mycena polygramma]|nr:hypothetical protein DFH06DRAFT_1485669 [Mycena polygramma]